MPGATCFMAARVTIASMAQFSPNRVFGEAGDDTLIGGYFNDTLTGRTGEDVFNVGVNMGYTPQAGTITDFVMGNDRIDMRDAGVHSWARVLEGLIADGAGNATILVAWDGEVSVKAVLSGVRSEELSAADFIF